MGEADCEPILKRLSTIPLKKHWAENGALFFLEEPLLPMHLFHFFRTIGVPVYEGWGLTEASTPVTNRQVLVRAERWVRLFRDGNRD